MRLIGLVLILGIWMRGMVLADRMKLNILVFRHGIREALIQQKEGPLTASGKLQAYLLGKESRTRYVKKLKYLDESFNPDQVYLQTSPKKRAIQSLLWFLSGFYPGTGEYLDKTFIPERDFSQKCFPPIEISRENRGYPGEVYQRSPAIEFIKYSAPDLNNDLFYHAYDICPEITEIIDKVDKTDEYRALADQFDEVWTFTARYINRKLNTTQYNPAEPNFKKLGKFLDFIRSNADSCNKQSEELVEDFPEDAYEQLQIAKIKYIELKFGNEFVQKAVVTEHFLEIIHFLEEKFKNKNHRYEALKTMVYSCHDRNIYLILLNLCTREQFLNLGEDGHFQKFASLLNFEFYETVDGSVRVILLYNDRAVEIKCSDQEDGSCSLLGFLSLLESRVDMFSTNSCYQPKFYKFKKQKVLE